ncbi:MAG TPA: class I SAM-dependent methyltransferase [Vicinamibacteria bacterium]|nr:class I SAM-dependent methyltransferase [Vicinamibacteria bacterium]
MSLALLEEHAAIWAEKPALRRVYSVWFEGLLAGIPPGARVIEVGAGPGLFAAYARQRRPDLRWVASELTPAAWNDVAADAEALPFRTGAADAVLGLDVLHHLARPRAFFQEAARVIRPGGCLALVEPWVTPLSFLVYRFFHQEACAVPADAWNPFSAAGGKDPFDGNAAVPRELVRRSSEGEWRALGLGPPQVELLNAFAYLLTLGFRRASLLPAPLAGPALWLDGASRPLARLAALRARLCWTCRPPGPTSNQR